MAARSMGFEISNRSVSIINCSVDRDNGGYCLRKLKLNLLIKVLIYNRKQIYHHISQVDKILVYKTKGDNAHKVLNENVNFIT